MGRDLEQERTSLMLQNSSDYYEYNHYGTSSRPYRRRSPKLSDALYRYDQGILTLESKLNKAKTELAYMTDMKAKSAQNKDSDSDDGLQVKRCVNYHICSCMIDLSKHENRDVQSCHKCQTDFV